MPENRPRGREKNVTGQGKDVYKRGDGLGTGPVGNQSGYQGKNSGNGGNGGGKRSSGGSSIITIIIAAIVLLGGGGGFLSNILGGGSSSGGGESVKPSSSYSSSGVSASSGSTLSSILGGLGGASFSGGNVSTGWDNAANTGKLDTRSEDKYERYTTIRGGGKDDVTIMVYMCGTDLESKYGMGTSDLQEMTSATLSDNVNLIVYTGGCRQWKNNIVSNTVNQIYKVEKGGIRCIESDVGNKSMTNPDTLTSFIGYCRDRYAANRNILIFWDHGGGSVTGYGYDEKNKNTGSMSLAGINAALKNSGMKFDFIGFDACLMATAENALVISHYADYMIASEETEPGLGWYYTNWLTALSQNTSLSTLEIGKKIVDDFVDVSAQKCRGQSTTLSVVDLGEFNATFVDKFAAFCNSVTSTVYNGDYSTVSKARSGSREFASSSKIDQIDLVHFAGKVGTEEGKALANAILSSVKYNRTSSDMTNAYGLSFFFPVKNSQSLKSAEKTYKEINVPDEYSKCLKAFTTMQYSGQATSSGTGSALSSFGSVPSSSASAGGNAGTDMISSLLGSLFSGNIGGISGLSGSGMTSDILSGILDMNMDRSVIEQTVTANRFNVDNLVWVNGSNGKKVISLSEEQWELVSDLQLNVFLDDGKGYIDLGMDNVFDFTDKGELIGEYDGTWLAINNQPVAYYYESTYDDGENYCIKGRVPCLINGDRANLILVFDNANPYGYISGVRFDYRSGETGTVAKGADGLQNGDVIDFLCDYYSYSNQYIDSYMLGDSLTVSGNLTISNVYIDASKAVACYCFTDIYNEQYWTTPIQ